MFYQIFQYVKFLLKSTNQHGVHSPFVYDLVTKCFYDRTRYPEYFKIKDFITRLKRVKLKLDVTDFGAGSKKLNTEQRKVSNIAKVSGTTVKRAKLLFRVVKYFEFQSILELGTSLGFSSQAMSKGNPDAKIDTIEGCPNISKYTKKHFQMLCLDNINVITGNIDEKLEDLSSKTYDLVFFDGNHQKAPTLYYFETLLPTAHNDTVFIFDDIYWSKDMTEAWDIIKHHPKVSITIDTFYWGFVFFRKEQAKEHFLIRV
ncbi:O-methyltransferase [Seonamhaeicola marinus]|uniref:Class I SAM-dependent methyltransferase n=1 Tax=Seonamhaeicola marinus TaxID=1912246 RepID=A0A5D0HJ25_9FLAO|nr:class I SAM-dependent methyltransferase [Seonamhaeicola marinus]TYA71404.1 class I SAM-dependent methyltransferase [Seonamhaeicola marinus]